MRKWLVLTILFSGLVLGQGLPGTGAFVKPVTLEASRSLPLEAALRLIAQAAGVDLLVGAVPSVEVRGRISGPFRQVFETLITVYGGGQVGYRLVGNTVVVGPKEAATISQVSAEPTAPSLRYLGFASSGGRALGAVEVLGRVYLLRVGDPVPGTVFQVVSLSPGYLEVASGGTKFRYALGAEEARQ